MKSLRHFIGCAVLAAGALASACCFAQDAFDFNSAWAEQAEHARKGRARSSADLLAKIEREAIAVKRWPDAARALVERTQAEREFTDDWRSRWIPEFERQISSYPDELRVFLDLVLAHAYVQNSQVYRWGGARPTKLSDAAAAEKDLPPWSPERLPASLETIFARLLSRADTLKRERVADWNDLFHEGNMPDSCRPTLYDIAVHEILSFYGSSIPDKTLEKGLALLDALIAFHANDLDARADAELARIKYVRMFAECPEKKRSADFTDALDAFLAKYADKTCVADVAAYERASFDHLAGDLVKARARALAVAEKHPDSVGGKLCRVLVATIDQPSMFAETEIVWSKPWPKIRVRSRNLAKAHFRLVEAKPADFLEDGYLRQRHVKERKYGSVVRTWSEAIADPGDYREHDYDFDVPTDLKSGCYVLYSAMNEKFGEDNLPVEAQFVQVTDLALGFAFGNGGVCGTLYRALEGTRVADATVELWSFEGRGKDRKPAVLKTVKTDADGTFSFSVESKNCRLRAISGSDAIMTEDALYTGYVAKNDESPLRIALQTDRAIYRPGQTIRFKGYLSHMDRAKRNFHVLADTRAIVRLCDPNGKTVAEETFTSSEWGTFSGSFAAPSDRLTGGYSLRAAFADSKAVVRCHEFVRVEEYKRPKFSVEFDPAPNDAALGRPVTASGRARTYSGLPIADAKVEWHVVRRTRYADWFLWFGVADDTPQIASGEAKTSADGVFSVAFTPEADPTADLEGEPSFIFEVSAVVTDTTGEARDAQSRIEIGTVAWRAHVGAPRWLVKGAVTSAVNLTSLDGKNVTAKGTLRAFRRKGPASPVRKPAERLDWWTRQEEEKKGGPWDWTTWPDAEKVFEREIAIENGEWKGALPLDAGAYRLEFETRDPAGKRVYATGNALVVDPAAKKLGIPIPHLFLADREDVSCRVGDKIRFVWASGYATGICRMEILSNGTVVRTVDNPAESPFIDETYEVADRDRGQIECRVHFFRESRLYTETRVLYVEWDNQQLKITTEHLNSKLVCGSGEERWTFRVSGPSEVLALLYDRSLDAYAPHAVKLPFNGFSPIVPSRPILRDVNVIRGFDWVRGVVPSPNVSASAPQWRGLAEIFIYGFGTFEKRRRGFGVPKMKMACASRAPAGELGCANVAVAACADAVGLDANGGADRDGALRGEKCCEPQCLQAGASDKSVLRKAGAEAPDVVRANLNETAFFTPKIVTNDKGEFEVVFTVPDAITGWKLGLVAHDKTLRCGTLTDASITTTKPLMVEPNPPRFVREGDDFEFVVKVTNTERSPQKCRVSLAFEDADLGGPAPIVRGLGECEIVLAPHSSTGLPFRVAVPDGQGFLKYVARAKGAAFSDGEEGYLATLSRRVAVREAVQLNLRGAGEKKFALTNLIAAAKAGSTVRSVDLSVRVVSRPAWYAVMSLPYLMEFPCECCEQTFGRYYANALGEHLANADPRVRETFDAWAKTDAGGLKSPLERNARLRDIALEATPWVREAEHESVARRRVGTLFGSNRLAAEQKRCLEKLEADLTDDGLFPWFPGGRGNEFVTLYVLVGFARLNHLAKTPYPDFFARAVEALDAFETACVRERKKLTELKPSISGFDVRWLYLHSFAGAPDAPKETREWLLNRLREDWPALGVESQALAATVLARGGESEKAKEILSSLRERAVESEEFGLYWKRHPFFSSSIFAAPVSEQAIVVEAFQEALGDRETADLCRVWLLKQKQSQNWSSTASTADAIYAILLGGGVDFLAGDTLATVSLGGADVPKENAEKGTGTYSKTYRGREVKPEMGEIVLKGDDARGVVWGGVNWTYLEDVLKVKRFEPEELRIEKTWFRKVRTADGSRLESLAGGLEPGDEIVSRLALRCDRTLEYVHIRDERPTCAEPVDVISAYRWQDGVGYYQSTRDTATHYYLDRLNRGEFVLETSYRVQQRGRFAGGLATIQCQYAPEFTAHSTAQEVSVGR